jgi:hypothetical protein
MSATATPAVSGARAEVAGEAGGLGHGEPDAGATTMLPHAATHVASAEAATIERDDTG